jgi:hypothetical protein
MLSVAEECDKFAIKAAMCSIYELASLASPTADAPSLALGKRLIPSLCAQEETSNSIEICWLLFAIKDRVHSLRRNTAN